MVKFGSSREATMRAIVYSRTDEQNLRFAEVSKPKPRAEEVLVAVRAAGVNPMDYKQLGAPGRVAGTDFAGEVVAVGDAAGAAFAVGDAVFGFARGA